jgi:hypothetical protein
MHGDAEVPINLWNDRLTPPWRSLAGLDDIIDEELNVKLYKAAVTIRNTFMLPCWKKNMTRSFMVWFETNYRAQLNLTPPQARSMG